MKVSDLIAELSKFPGDLEAKFEASIVVHDCMGDERCYCMAEDVRFSLSDVDRETLQTAKREGWTLKSPGKLKIPIVVIRGSEDY